MEFADLLLASLKDIAAVFNEGGFNYCLAGGLAVGMLSTPRATEDIDLVVAIDRSERHGIESALRRKFVIVQSKKVVDFSFCPIWRLILTRGEEVEVIVLDLLIAENEILRKALKNPIVIEIDGVLVPVATRESLIAMKEPSQRAKDQADIEALRQETQ